MGLFDWLFGRGAASGGEAAYDVADRLDRAADRFRNAGDRKGENAARRAAAEARRCRRAADALAVERAFFTRWRDPGKPVAGRVGSSGPEFVQYGNSMRAGGTREWRYNNPGRVPCTDRSSSYGAIGCDGELAIFPDYSAGVLGLSHYLRDEYHEKKLRDALGDHLDGTGIDPNALIARSGLNPDAKVADLTDADVSAFGDACREGGGWQEGNQSDRGSESSPTSADEGIDSHSADASHSDGVSGHTDNS